MLAWLSFLSTKRQTTPKVHELEAACRKLHLTLVWSPKMWYFSKPLTSSKVLKADLSWNVTGRLLLRCGSLVATIPA
jgi:hypothetical protein